MMKTLLFPIAVGAIAAVVGSIPIASAETQPVEFAPNPAPNNPADHQTSSDIPVDPSADPSTASSQNPVASKETVALNFEPPIANSPSPVASTPSAESPAATSPTTTASPGGENLFAGGSESVMARVVGAAEGTRDPDGGHTSLYEGHTDPGNGVWNRGTFSYQFGNEENLSAEEADRRQMAKIKRIYESVMLPKTQQNGVAPLTLSEELNGIDMINQAPLAVTEDGGYVERLAEAKKQKGLTGADAILEARVWAFWDPQRNGWDAPGLRAYDDLGKEASVRHDQQRRMGMIAEALDSYQSQHGAIASTPSSPPPKPANANRIADAIINNSSPPIAVLN